MPKNEDQENESVTFGSCRAIREECRSNSRWVITGLVAGFVAISGILYAAQSNNSNDISDAKAELAAQKTAIQNVDNKTTEMQRDIKELLRRVR